ncbi:dehydrogenase/reductase SDR family member FEY-like [Hevea brasiliensis]|uniref:dehydrogenase/reductase SDR family member FEY-like n=1 Tax=Hevea brasiliensis TaxID=3981 RepID=UPI0025E7E6B9|nr:dehydrogenase/reductase SDR family member FEY-like [Hevea brasiliensis]
MGLNLLSLNSVVKFAEQWNSRSKPALQVLVNNSEILSIKEPQKFSKYGYDAHMQVNHFAPALLSILLLPSLLKGSPSRIVNGNSILYSMGYVDTNDLNSTQKKLKYNSSKAYSKSKLAQVMFSSILQKNLPLEAGTSVGCVSHGRVLLKW